jgi:hypothetical protein
VRIAMGFAPHAVAALPPSGRIWYNLRMGRQERGTALVTVLLACSVLLVVCLSLGSLSILNLNLAGGYSIKQQSLLMAEAAVAQLKSELDKAQQADTGNAVEMEGANRPDLLARFQNPVFPEGADRFPGPVTITFDTHADHYSVDNSYSETPAAGWRDRGSSGQSVPPFSIDLLIGATIGSRTVWYEALLRRRWPYVLCTPGKVTMMGSPTYAKDGRTTTVQPSRIVGNIFSLPNLDFVPPPPSPEPGDEPYEPPADPSTDIFVDADLINNILELMPKERSSVNVGGTASLKPQISPGVYGMPVSITSTGNTLLGTVDISGSDTSSTVAVYPGNTDTGSVRHNVQPYNLAKNLQNAFQLPDISSFKELQMQKPPPDAPPVPPAPPPVPPAPPPNATDPNDPEATPGPTDVPLPSPSPSPSGSPSASPEASPTPPPYYVLYDDLVLNGPETPTFEYDESARYRIMMPAGNRYVMYKNPRKIYYTGAGIELHNAILYIDGDLDLSSTKPRDGDSAAVIPALRGTNATVIVNGTLLLVNGSLSASEKGMVIFCRRLVSAAQGHYRGLIMVQKSAAICPAFPGAVMEIQGGIVCGGAPVSLYALDPNYDPRIPDMSDTIRVHLQGLHLWSTRLTYDPRYMKTLNRFGPLEVLTIRPLE